MYPAALSLFFVLKAITSFASASDGTDVPLTLYTDIKCGIIDTVTPNVSLALHVCATTVGLGSVTVPNVPCAQGSVQVLAFDDTACVSEYLAINYGNNCVGRATDGSFGSIMLTCDEFSTDAFATTTVDLGVALAASATASAGTATSSSTPTSTPTSSSNGKASESWWDNLSIGAKIGLIIGCILAVPVIGFLIFGSRREPPKPQEPGVPVAYSKERWNPETGGFTTVHYELPKASQASSPYHGAYEMDAERGRHEMNAARERREMDSQQTMRYAAYAGMMNQMQQPAPTYNMNPGYGGGGA